MNAMKDWATKSLENLSKIPTRYDAVKAEETLSDPRMRPITLSAEVIEFMKDDVPIDCPFLKLRAGCMNCEYDELYKYVRCSKYPGLPPCTHILNIENS